VHFLVDFYSAAVLLAMQSAVIPTAIPSVRPSVCPSHAGTLSIRMKIESRGFHCEVPKHPSFLTPTMVGGRRPLPLKICAQSDPLPSEIRRIRPISAYNVSTVRDSEKSSIIANRKLTTRFPASYRWSPYVTPKSPKGGSKSKFVIFLWIKINLNRINSATEFLCVKTSIGIVIAGPFPYLTVYICWGKCNPLT